MKTHELLQSTFDTLHEEAVDQCLRLLKQHSGLSPEESNDLVLYDPDADQQESMQCKYSVKHIDPNGDIFGQYYHGDSCCFNINTLKVEELIFLIEYIELNASAS